VPKELKTVGLNHFSGTGKQPVMPHTCRLGCAGWCNLVSVGFSAGSRYRISMCYFFTLVSMWRITIQMLQLLCGYRAGFSGTTVCASRYITSTKLKAFKVCVCVWSRVTSCLNHCNFVVRNENY